MKNTKVTLSKLAADDRERFILDNQEAFKFGAVEEFGMRDNTTDDDGVLPLRSVFRISLKKWM